MKDNRRDLNLLIGLFALLWLVVVFLGYLYIHKPFSPGELLGILTALWHTLIALGILSLAGGIGMLTKIREWNAPPLTSAMLASAFGLGIMGIFTLIMSSTIGINPALWILFLIAGVILRKKILNWWKYWHSARHLWQETSLFGRIVFFLIAIILACQYIEALAPPYQFDALTYHLALPKAYLQTGRITYLPDNIFWGMPQQVEMLYMLTMSLGGSEAAPILGWWMGVLTLAGLLDFAKRIYGSDAAWTAVAGLAVGSGLTASLSSGYIEWASILFGLSVLICIFQWMNDDELLTLGISGVFAGLALSTKYTNEIILISGGAAILLLHKPASWKKLFIGLTWFGGMAILTMLPWMIKNLISTSNPFYPLFIPSGAMDTTLLDFYQFKPIIQDWARLLLIPWQATIMGIDGGEGFSSSIGPLLLGFAPLALFHWRGRSKEQKTATKLSGVILISGFFIWAIGSQFRGLLIQTRLYFVVFPSWALLVAAGYMTVANINYQNIRFRNLAGTIILIALVFNVFSTITATTVSNPMPAILSLEDRTSYLKRHLGSYADAMQTITSLPDNARIVMLWETRGMECLPKCDPDEIIGRWYHDWSIYRNRDAVLQSWKQQGYTHVLLNNNGAEFVRKYDVNAPPMEYWDGLQATMDALTRIDMAADGYQLYQLP